MRLSSSKKTHVLLFLSLSLEHWLKVFRSFMDMMRENLISRQSSGKRSGIYRRETRKFFGSKTDMVPVFGIPWYRQEMRNDVKRLMVHYSALDTVGSHRDSQSPHASRHQGISRCHSGGFGQLVLTCYHCYHVALIIQYYIFSVFHIKTWASNSLHAQIQVVREVLILHTYS